MKFRIACVAAIAAAALAGCESSHLEPNASTGPSPALPPPHKALLPTVHIAPAQGWPEGVMPTPAQGTRVPLFAKDLKHPRWVYVLPNGDVLVSETGAPEQPTEGKDLKGRVMKFVMKRAGAGNKPANRITLLRD